MKIRLSVGALAAVLLLAVAVLPSSAQQLGPSSQMLQNVATATGNGKTFDASLVSVVAFQVSGTFVGTVTFEGSLDATTWTALSCLTLDAATAVSTATAPGVWRCSVVGIPAVRARVSAYTSGSITVLANGTTIALAAPDDMRRLTVGPGAGLTISNGTSPPVCNQGHAVWLNPTLNTLSGCDGTGWQSDAALATKITDILDSRFSGKCDGITDDTTALNNAIAVGQPVLIPDSATPCVINGVVTNTAGVTLLLAGRASFSGAGAPTANVTRLAPRCSGPYVSGNFRSLTIANDNACGSSSQTPVSLELLGQRNQVGNPPAGIVDFLNNFSGTNYLLARIKGGPSAANTGILSFCTNPNATGPSTTNMVERMQITDGGAVLVGFGGGANCAGNNGLYTDAGVGVGGLSLGGSLYGFDGVSTSVQLIGRNASNQAQLNQPVFFQNTGPHGIGVAPLSRAQLLLGGTFTPTGGAADFGFVIASTIAAETNQDLSAFNVQPTLNAAGSGTNTNISTVELNAPTIGGLATVTNASTLRITGTPVTGTNRRALWIAGGGLSVGAVGEVAGGVNIATTDGYQVSGIPLRNVAETLSNKTMASPTALAAFVFANIGATLTVNGQIGYCSDCVIANPCAGAGTGAIAKRLNGVNVCN